MNNGLVFREDGRRRWGAGVLLTFIRPLSPIILSGEMVTECAL